MFVHGIDGLICLSVVLRDRYSITNLGSHFDHFGLSNDELQHETMFPGISSLLRTEQKQDKIFTKYLIHSSNSKHQMIIMKIIKCDQLIQPLCCAI